MATESEINEYFNGAAKVFATAYHHAMRGGEIQAAVRQGFNELGAALKAFPDAIQVDEPGQVFNPLFHDMVEDRQSHDDALRSVPQAVEPTTPPLPSPEKTAVAAPPEQQKGSVHEPPGGGIQGPERGVYGPEHGVYGRDNGMQAAPSAPVSTPGQLANDASLDDQSQERGSVHGQEAPARENATPGDIANDKDVDRPLGQGIEMAQDTPTPPKPGGFLDKELARRQQGGNAGNDQDEMSRGKVLPDDQLEHNKGRDR